MTDRQPTPGVHESFASNLMEQAEPCPVCDVLFRPDDLCATDIELGTCHAACLEGSPVVDLDTGNELPDGKIATYSYGDVAQEGEERFRLVAKHYMDALVEIATEDDLERANEVACKALGSTPAPQSHLRRSIAAFEKAYPELYWHIAKGKICAGEPLYGAIITTIGGTEIGHGESDESAEAAFAIAVAAAGLATTEGSADA